TKGDDGGGGVPAGAGAPPPGDRTHRPADPAARRERTMRVIRTILPRARRRSSGARAVSGWLLALLLLLPGTACARQAAQLPEAEAALRAGRYEEAVGLFSRLVAADPASVEARRGWARALMEVGRYEEAAEAARG